MRKYFFLIIIFLFIFSTLLTFGEEINLQTIEFPSGRGPAEYVNNIYRFSLGAAAITALAVIIFGAVEYAISAGNPARVADAKSRIFNALWGLVLLFGAYLILNTINPELVVLKEPELVPITQEEVDDIIEDQLDLQKKGLDSFKELTGEPGQLSQEEVCMKLYGTTNCQ